MGKRSKRLWRERNPDKVKLYYQKNQDKKRAAQRKPKTRGRKCTHGMSRTKEYRVFVQARSRCNDPRNHDYPNYGGRGIAFRFTSFAQFRAELGPRPEGLTLERINNDGHYEPGNVCWATWSEQRRNQRPKQRGA